MLKVHTCHTLPSIQDPRIQFQRLTNWSVWSLFCQQFSRVRTVLTVRSYKTCFTRHECFSFGNFRKLSRISLHLLDTKMTTAIMGRWSAKVSIHKTVTRSQIFHYFTAVHGHVWHCFYGEMKLCSYDCSKICLGQREDFVLSNGKVVSVHAMKAYGGVQV